jgi:hypothetical protein
MHAVAVSPLWLFCEHARKFYAHNSVHCESILKKYDTFVQYFYFLQAALRVSGETFTHHQELKLYSIWC